MNNGDICESCGHARVFHQIGRGDTVPVGQTYCDDRHAAPCACTKFVDSPELPIPMLLWCPCCHARHYDEGEFAIKPHHTHACQHCGVVWRPAVVATVGVQFLPGFKNTAVEPTR